MKKFGISKSNEHQNIQRLHFDSIENQIESFDQIEDMTNIVLRVCDTKICSYIY